MRNSIVGQHENKLDANKHLIAEISRLNVKFDVTRYFLMDRVPQAASYYYHLTILSVLPSSYIEQAFDCDEDSNMATQQVPPIADISHVSRILH